MSDVVVIGDKEAVGLAAHPLRAAVLNELHARPFTSVAVPSRILHFAFDTSGGGAQTDRTNLVEFCRTHGIAAPSVDEKYHRVPFEATALRWEQHSEFTTYTWEIPCDAKAKPFEPSAASLASPMGLLPQPGPLLVALNLHLLADGAERTAPERLLQRPSLAIAENSDGTAVYATDFQPDSSGFVRILVIDR